MKLKYCLEKYSRFIVYLLFPLLIIIVMGYGMKSIMTIHIASDEFGYWTAAANIMNYDWSYCASWNEYYSFGYGFLLAPLFLIENPNLTYKFALYLNIAFIVGAYYLLVKIIYTFTDKKTLMCCGCIAVVISFYPGLIFYSKLSMVECFLWCAFIGSIYYLQKFIITKKKRYVVVANIINSYAVWVHMRAIGILIALVLCLMIYVMYARKIERKDFLILIIFMVCILGMVHFKTNLKEAQYALSQNTGNELAGQVDKIQSLLSIEGIKQFLFNFVGRIWYLGNTTFFIFYIGVVSCIRKIIRKVIERNEIVILFLYIFTSILSIIAISSLFMIYLQNGRKDILIYGRYSDFVLAPILAIGMIEFIRGMVKIKYIFIFGIFHLICAISVRAIELAYNMSSCLDVAIPGFYYWFYKNDFSNDSYISASMITVSIVLLSNFILTKKRLLADIFIGCLICIFWINMGYKSYEISDTHKHDEDYYQVYTVIQDNLKEANKSVIYCYDSEDMKDEYYHKGIDRIQFLLKGKSIVFCNLEKENPGKKSIVVVRNHSLINEYFKQYAKKILENNEFNVFLYEGE